VAGNRHSAVEITIQHLKVDRLVKIEAVGIKIVGTLLMGALVIIPAAAAKNLSRDLGHYGVLSAELGLLGTLLGIYSAHWLNFSPGPLVVLASALIFFLSLLPSRLPKASR